MTARWDETPNPRSATNANDVASELQDAEERRAVILGTLRAALSVGMVYVVVFGIVIACMVWLWA